MEFIWALYAQLYSLAVTPQIPTLPQHLDSFAKALLVSQDRRYLCVTPWPGHSQSFPQLRVNNRLCPKNFKSLFYSLRNIILKIFFMNVGINEDILFDGKMTYCYRSTCCFMIGIKNF
jgi:hypothetical protein